MSLIFFNPRYAYFVVKNVLSLITIKLNNPVFSLNHLYFPKYVFLRKTETRFCRGRSSHQRCSIKKVFLEISQNSQESTCARVSFLLKRLWLWDFIKKETLTQVFSCNFVKFLRTPFLTEHLRWLLLNVRASSIGTYAKFPPKPRFS